MARPKSYRELIAWQKAMALAKFACGSTEKLPRREAYGLADQIRRAAVSVASNIAEGYGRLSDLQFRHFLGNARGSLYELRTQVELATDLQYFDKETGEKIMELSAEVGRILNGLIASLSSAKNGRASSSNSASSANPANPANSAHSSRYA
jgi:four helix bundle protein